MTRRSGALQGAVNAIGFALLVWYGGPLLALADWRPLETPAARWGLLAAVAVALLLAGPLQQWRTRRRNAALVDVLQPATGEQSLAPRFRQAMGLLREGLETGAAGAPWLRWWRRRQQLIRQPWYLFIGAPGAGKTTALLNSGLRFPLADRLGTAPVKGVAGTRQCDWWFTDRAVFIDTAGRYTTQDSHAESDAREWRSFLGLLRRHRPRQPINGVLVTVSVPDLLAGGAELARQCAAVNARLQELRETLGLSLPVYVLVTKADLLAGFTEFFDRFDTAQREQVWGTTFAYAPAGGLPPAHAVAADLQALVARLQALTLPRLQNEPAAARRSPIYHFAAQVEALLPALGEFVGTALAQADRAPAQALRGVYFSSGTQEGNPIDRVLGTIARQHGVAARTLPRPDGRGRAYFLQQLLQSVVIAEADLAGGNLQRLQRERRIALAATGVACAALLALAGAWWSSHANNRAYIAEVGQRVQLIAQQVARPAVRSSAQVAAAPLAPPAASASSRGTAPPTMTAAAPPPGQRQVQTSAASPDHQANAMRWLPLYQLLRHLPQPGGADPMVAPPGHGWGLFQGARLARTAQQTYHRILANTLAPALADRLAGELRRPNADPEMRHQTLKTYLMLVQPQRLDRATVRNWAARAFEQSPDGPVDAAERNEWLQHVDALLQRNAFQDAVSVDEAAVAVARKALAALPLPRRVLAKLQGDDSDAPPRQLDAWLGPLLPLLFDPAGGEAAPRPISPFLTRQGLQERFLARLDPTLRDMVDEDAWVLGTVAGAAGSGAAAPESLRAEVTRLYADAYAAQWRHALAAWQLHRPADADALARLNAQLAAANSPLRQWLVVVDKELTLTDLAPDPVVRVVDAVLAERFGALRAYAAGPGPAALDRALGAVARYTLGSGADASAAPTAQLLRQEAGAAPAPFNAVWSALAESLLSAHQSALRQGLAARLDDVAGQCRNLIGNRYPFNASAVGNDVTLGDFARLFGPDGVFDTFFRRDLQPHVETRQRPWRYRDGQAVAGESLLRSFERIDDLRRAFFSAGSPLPALRFSLRPIEMDLGLEEFLLDVDGQLLRYENGPSVPKSMSWPGPAAAQRVTLRARGVPGEIHEGPWVLLRVLAREPWQRGAEPGASRVAVTVGGRRLVLDLRLAGAGSTSVLAGLSSFRCPEAGS